MEEMAWTSHKTEVSNDNLWYVNNYGTLLCCFSLKEKRIIQVENIPYSGNRSELLYSNILAVDNYLILVPANAFYVILYNINSREFITIGLNLNPKSYNMFCGCERWENKLFLIPYNVNFVISIDLNTLELKKECDLAAELCEDGFNTVFRGCYALSCNRIYFLSNYENRVWCYNMEENKISSELICEKKIKCTAIATNNDKIFIIDENSDVHILGLNLEYKGKTKNKYKKREMFNFIDGIRINDNIYFFQAEGDKIIKYNYIKQIILEQNIGLVMRVSLLNSSGDNIYGFDISRKRLFEYNCNKASFKYYNTALKLNENEAVLYMQNNLNTYNVVKECEHGFDTLNIFIKSITGSVMKKL